MDVLTAAEIRAVEEKENSIGTNFYDLMEKAGTSCANHIMERYPKENGPVVCVTGKGKNGGDGFVIARKLKAAGYDVELVLAFGVPTAEDAVKNYALAVDAGVPVLDYPENPEKARGAMGTANVVVDSIFGIGFHGAASPEQAEIFDYISQCDGNVVAIDVPSGVDTDTGAVHGSAVYADVTYAISTRKPAHVFYPARGCCGETEVLDIGILPESFNAASPTLMTLNAEEVAQLLPIRSVTSHKNDFGHVLSICGSMRMPGAACMCANSAIKSGAGLVTAAFPQRAYPAISSHITEGMMVPLPDTPDGMVSINSLNMLHFYMQRATTLVMGCGLGQSAEVRAVVTDVLQNAHCPVVLDADGLNAVAQNPDILSQVDGEVIVTPHPGEMSRLLNAPVPDILNNRVAAASEFANHYKATVLLKGPDTVVASYHTNKIYVNITGNQGLAKGGSGDTLSGIIAALVAQGMSPFYAAVCGAWIHGHAADYAAKTISYRGMTASDLIASLPFILKEFE